MPTLDKQTLKTLRQRAHALKPVIRIGQQGLSEAVLAELEIAIAHHGLIKVKLAGEDAAARQTQIETMLSACEATLVQRIGHVACLYREPAAEVPSPVRTERGPRGPRATAGQGRAARSGRPAGRAAGGSDRRGARTRSNGRRGRG